jgi:primosomal protein N' (replication factor Y)
MKIAHVALPVPYIQKTLDYLLTSEHLRTASAGHRVLVQVGKGLITGYITKIVGISANDKRTLKPIHSLLDDEPLLTDELIELCTWISDYYFTNLGELLKAALPPGINVSSSEEIRLSERGKQFLSDYDLDSLHGEDETAMFTLLDLVNSRRGIKVSDLVKEIDSRQISISLSKNYVEIFDKQNKPATIKIAKAVTLIPKNGDHIAENLTNKQRDVYQAIQKYEESPLLSALVNEKVASRSIIKTLVKKGFADISDVQVRRDPFKNLSQEMLPPHDLTSDQVQVYSELESYLSTGKFKVGLLHGVTGSGKTEIYLHLIQKALSQGKTSLVLIPEIALTPQFAKRFYQALGKDLAILHSGMKRGERIDEWFRIREGRAKVVLGTRLSLFSPLVKLGLIIVDEEHDQSYKQEDRINFHARDMAVIRASMNGALCVLGSATPSSESMANAQKTKYRLLNLHKRVFDRPLPDIQIVDLRKEKSSEDDSQIFPDLVENHLLESLERKEQSIILVNRKGHSGFILCRSCGYSFQCRSCSISMTWHQAIEKLKCHYCGALQKLPPLCPKCGSTSIKPVGLGSEKVERYLQNKFASATVARMDRDTIRKTSDYSTLLESFGGGKIDILVGTQMLSKGHDYANVTTIVTLGVDSLLRLPDFRHSERVFQLLTQVSGRAGRGEIPGKVFICTFRPEHFAIKSAAQGNFDTFYETELEYRRSLGYPPFGFLTMLIIEKYKKEDARAHANSVSEFLHEKLGTSAYILGPSLAPYARLKNRWRYQIILKSLDRKKTKEVLSSLMAIRSLIKDTKIIVDPLSVM